MSSSSLECPICTTTYRRDINPPMSIVPCGHNICKVCLETMQGSGLAWARKCPLCQNGIEQQMMNWALLDNIETRNSLAPNPQAVDPGQALSGATAPPAPGVQTQNQSGPAFDITKLRSRTSPSRQYKEVIRDATEAAFCVLDNSGSMDERDGKRFEKDKTGRLIKKGGGGSVSRWDEAVHKCKQVAEYNFTRGVPSTYYLLNPQKAGNWIAGVDYVEVDPQNGDNWECVLQKLQPLFASENVRGSTPLDVITDHLWSRLNAETHAGRISYILFTDGEPNDEASFEQSVKNLANAVQLDGLQALFLTVNLCTDEDDVVEYYNDLDQKLGAEVSGMDVLDDFESELQEIMKAKNTFVTYTEELHICRMAGCNSPLGDLLDEKRLGGHYMAKMVREVLRLDFGVQPCSCGARNKVSAKTCHACGEVSQCFDPDYNEMAWIDDTEGFLQVVSARNPQVWDFWKKRFTPLFDVSTLRREFKRGNTVGRRSVDDCCRWTLLVFFLAILFAYLSSQYPSPQSHRAW